ncbi:class II fructose-bisphosphate aldolase, partial [Streptomyces sp. NPDC006324]|uniref:class II fructose-bisphosphate aldolase n=1 Tax=Streptomyces sp. NPDC006324 TaxID=3156751 RepID=UPI0033A57D5F
PAGAGTGRPVVFDTPCGVRRGARNRVTARGDLLTRDAVLDFDLIARLRVAVDVPLVLHGSSGVSNADLATAVTAGMTKVNVSTHLNKAFTRAVRDHLADHPDAVDPRHYLTPARAAVAREVAHLLTVLAPA